MIKKLPNPFTPSHPASPQNLKGRENQLLEIDKCLYEAKRGGINNFLIIGDRGIGKTSLLHYANRSAQDWSNYFEDNFQYIIINIKIEKSTNQLDLAKEIYEKIRDVLRKNNSIIANKIEKAWEFIQRVEIHGNKIKPADEFFSKKNKTISSIAEALIQTAEEHCTTDGFDGILILIDEADQASSEIDLGSFIKYVTEYLNFAHCSKIIFGLSGLPSTKNILISSHASSLRVFNTMEIPKLKKQDFLELIYDIQISLLDTYKIEFSVTDDAINYWWNISDGHPHHLQQIGYHTFKTACFDNKNLNQSLEINMQHLQKALYETNGVIDIIGLTYCNDGIGIFQESIFVEIFRALCSNPKYSCSVGQLTEEISNSTLKNIKECLLKLTELELVKCDTQATHYMVKYPLYAHWFSQTFPEIITL